MYSLTRDSDLSAEEYLTGFFDTGLVHQGNVEEPIPVQRRGTATDRTEPDDERPQGAV